MNVADVQPAAPAFSGEAHPIEEVLQLAAAVRGDAEKQRDARAPLSRTGSPWRTRASSSRAPSTASRQALRAWGGARKLMSWHSFIASHRRGVPAQVLVGAEKQQSDEYVHVHVEVPRPGEQPKARRLRASWAKLVSVAGSLTRSLKRCR
jgi:hypothetical protein